jgi:acyl carrier protein
MSDEIAQRVLQVIATSKRIPLETVTIDAPFEQLNIDSMDAVEIIFAIENEFDINIPDEDVRAVRSVRQMCEGVEKLVTAKAAAPSPAPAGSPPAAPASGEPGQ